MIVVTKIHRFIVKLCTLVSSSEPQQLKLLWLLLQFGKGFNPFTSEQHGVVHSQFELISVPPKVQDLMGHLACVDLVF